jgi:hypothetical protein
MTTVIARNEAAGYGLTPSVKLRFPDGSLTEALSRIVVGPRVTSPDTEHKVRALLANAGVRYWSKFPIERALAACGALPIRFAADAALPAWFADYNENHPHKGLKMLSPWQFRRAQSP